MLKRLAGHPIRGLHGAEMGPRKEDLISKHRALTNAQGLASFEDPDGLEKASRWSLFALEI